MSTTDTIQPDIRTRLDIAITRAEAKLMRIVRSRPHRAPSSAGDSHRHALDDEEPTA